MDVEKYRKFVISRKDRLENLREEKVLLDEKHGSVSKTLNGLKMCKEVMNAIGVTTQTETQEVIEELVTKALQCTFGEEYSFVVQNRIMRNSPQTEFYIKKGDNLRPLKEGADGSEGGSVAVLVATILRIVLWSMDSDNTRKSIVLDEPLKDSSKDKLLFLGQFIRELSEMMGVQITLITHETELRVCADRTFHVLQQDGISRIKTE